MLGARLKILDIRHNIKAAGYLILDDINHG